MDKSYDMYVCMYVCMNTHQHRSYVLHPYQLVKDHRTGVEVAGEVGSRVLEQGELDGFIEAALSSSCEKRG